MWLSDAVVTHLREVTDEPDLSATKYRLVRALGRGGMGVVYVARDVELDRDVAVKVSTGSGSSAQLCARLRREARVIARLEHPGIVPVHDVGTLPDGRAFYVMRLVRGERLDAWARGTRDHRVVLRLFERICDAVAFAHAHGVLHRDLKPENVMVGAFGEALVMDWGVAKELTGESNANARDAQPTQGATADGAVVGTPAYMAPEQARGDRAALDVRTDVYGLGAILYFLAARRAPFEGDSHALLDRVADGAPRPLREVAPGLPKPLASICEKAMAKAPADRYPSALDLARDVARLLDAEPVRAHREGAVERAARFASRHRVVLSLLGAYVALRVILIAIARWG